jgi:hypothetical protein
MIISTKSSTIGTGGGAIVAEVVGYFVDVVGDAEFSHSYIGP